MTPSVSPVSPQQQQRTEIAIDWLLRLNENPQDDELLAQWLAWCSAETENLEEFRRTCDLWNTFDTQELRALLALPQMSSVAASNGAVPRPGAAQPPSPRAMTRRKRWRLAAAAAVMLSLTAAFFMRQQLEDQNRILHVTQLAQHTTDTLEDGSVMDIGAGSRITTQYREDIREVEVQKGEAFFEVAKDPERPFVVRAGEISARAVGTAFNVRTGVNRTVVTVSHGLVEVQSKRWFDLAAADDERRALAGPGEQVIYDKTNGRLRVEQVDAEVATSWRQGLQTFRFVNEPLADVIAYLNRYSSRKIIIRDSTLGRRTFTGTVHHDRADDWLLALERAYPLHVSRLDGDGTIELLPTNSAVANR
jgi:transmembrane sensor